MTAGYIIIMHQYINKSEITLKNKFLILIYKEIVNIKPLHLLD